MSVLILSVTAGQGHHQTGLALSSYLTKKGIETTQLDCYEYLNPIVKEMISNGYLMSTKYSPTLYGRFYRLAEKMDALETQNLLSKVANTIFYKKMMSYIEENDPKVIVCTHVFAGILMTYLIEKGMDIPVIGIVTDFTIHPYWESTNLNRYVIANEYLIPALVNKGISPDKALPFGIPIYETFSQVVDKKVARETLLIDDKKTILMMGGSMGFGNMVKTIKKIDILEFDFQIITVCGNNVKLNKRIDSLTTNHKIYNFGYVSNVDMFMSASDCIITKPGGLSTSESLAKELPMLISKPIPGQEDRNLDFLLNFGCGMRISKTTPVNELISQMLIDDRKITNMISNIKLIKKPNAVEDLYNEILKLSKLNKNMD